MKNGVTGGGSANDHSLMDVDESNGAVTHSEMEAVNQAALEIVGAAAPPLLRHSD